MISQRVAVPCIGGGEVSEVLEYAGFAVNVADTPKKTAGLYKRTGCVTATREGERYADAFYGPRFAVPVPASPIVLEGLTVSLERVGVAPLKAQDVAKVDARRIHRTDVAGVERSLELRPVECLGLRKIRKLRERPIRPGMIRYLRRCCG